MSRERKRVSASDRLAILKKSLVEKVPASDLRLDRIGRRNFSLFWG